MSDSFKHGAGVAKLREQVNQLAWLLAEEKWKNERRYQRTYTGDIEAWHGQAGDRPTGTTYYS